MEAKTEKTDNIIVNLLSPIFLSNFKPSYVTKYIGA